ncbi:MAG: phosphatase PAP2 family protein [Thermomicrobiales bacterium]|nr:phosphatase PAP2 family protein [Thermomicrobiales bacterium]
MATNLWELTRPFPARPSFALGGGLRVARQALTSLSPVLFLYVIYTLVRYLVADRGPRLGPDHAASLLDLERALRLDWERPIQSFGLRHDWLVMAANWYYVAGFLPVLVLAAALAAWRAPEAFLRWRRIFSVSLALALVGFALFPLCPPRLMPESHGYIDTLMTYGPRYYGDAHGSSLFNGYGRLPSMVNEYAAMPSMHVAWAAIGAIMIALVIGRRWAWSLAVAHPAMMAFTVVVTGNHYVMDVVGGLIALAVAIAAVTCGPAFVARFRPAFTPAAAPRGAASYGD